LIRGRINRFEESLEVGTATSKALEFALEGRLFFKEPLPGFLITGDRRLSVGYHQTRRTRKDFRTYRVMRLLASLDPKMKLVTDWLSSLPPSLPQEKAFLCNHCVRVSRFVVRFPEPLVR
jgi:hypothetical protein